MSETLRLALAIAAFVVLVGGYYAHQWMLLSGRLDEWTARISGLNLVLGWLFILGAVVFSLWKVEE
ncbi:MAG: hypothetical protein C4340_04100 [Armatimonadota bacterium]